MSNLNLKTITNWPNRIARFGKGVYAMQAARDAKFDVQHKPYTNVCPHCHRTSGGRQCVETNCSCVGCQGWW